MGYRFASRYIRRDEHVNDRPDFNGWAVSLSKEELNNLLNINLAITPVQFGKIRFDATEGTRVGKAAANNCRKLGLPAGITVWLDAEWTPTPENDKAIIKYINDWCKPVRDAGYEPGIYTGPGIGLNANQLYYDLQLRHYWKSASYVPIIRTRGYQMVQGLPCRIMGITLDQDMVCIDGLGDIFKWVTQ
jgi:hypothetical protein